MARKRVSDKEIVVSAPAPVRHKTATPRRTRRTTAEPVATAAFTATADQIAALAYSYWEARGYQDGSPEADWLRAEQELRVKAASAAA
jgi:hypothetical protein